MVLHDCAVCPNKTTKTCGACKAVFFCSPSCQKAIWSTHKWTCGKPLDSFSQAPLTKDEAAQLMKLHRMDGEGDERPWCWYNILRNDGLWDGPAQDLVDVLQLRRCSIPEPERSVILSDLRNSLFRAGCEYGLLPAFVVTPWVTVGKLHRAAWRWGPHLPAGRDGLRTMTRVWSNALHQYLILNTLRTLRESSSLPPGLHSGVEELALARTWATSTQLVRDLPDERTEGQFEDILRHCEETRTTTPGQRCYIYEASDFPRTANLVKVVGFRTVEELDLDLDVDVD
ncbi:Ankyrin repeat and MYND domain-containing protein 2 [Rhodotorula kratochvilovae]